MHRFGANRHVSTGGFSMGLGLPAILLALASIPTPSRAGDSPGAPPEAGAAPIEPVAVARIEGTAAPGLRVELCGCESEGGPLTYQWVQIGGPRAEIEDADRPDAGFVVPSPEGTLEFLLVVGNARGVDTSRVSVEVGPSKLSSGPDDLVADAGDDQIALVGQQVTLNGIRSRPRGRIGYRWIQVDGPPATLTLQDGYVFAFVPPSPGSYRFALVVAEGSRISEPSFVDVTAGVMSQGSASKPGPAAAPAAPKAVPMDELAKSALRSVPGGEEAAGPLAEQFEAVASKMSLYESYADAYREIALRLEDHLPDAPGDRERWARGVFEPLTTGLVEALKPRGIDLSQPSGQASPLSTEQRAALSDQFREIAAGFRQARASR